MAIYLLIWVVLLAGAIGNWNRVSLFLIVFSLSVLAGLRDVSMGTDTLTYSYFYDSIREGNTPSNLEPGWVLFNKISIFLGFDYNGCLWLVSLFTLAVVAYVAVKDSPNPVFSIFVYYSIYAYLNSFNVMRQFVAVSFVLLGYHYLSRDKLTGFLVSILVAISFHVSAVIALGALLLRKIELNKFAVAVSLAITFLVGLILTYDMVVPFMGRYGHYITEGRYGYREGGFIYPILLSLLLGGWYIYLYSTSSDDVRSGLWMKLFWAAILLNNLSMKFILGARIILFFTISQVILYPIYINGTTERRRNLIIVTAYMAAIFLKVLLMGNTEETGVIPYRSIITDFFNSPGL